MTHIERKIRREEMKAYKADGHTMQEVADRFGVTKGYAQEICKGIAPQQRPVINLKNQYTSGQFDREANAKRYISERTPWFEFAGNFTGVDGYVDLKCKKCATVTRKSFVSIRHGTAVCMVCKAEENRKKREETEAKRKAKREADKKARQRQKELNKNCEQISMRTCPVCGHLFIGRRTYCSHKCMQHNKWYMKEGYRHLFPLEEVYERDNGICYICGKPCDWNDKEERNGVIIYGNNYPSRDHVKPKSRGGQNEWTNIRLAHRLCNSLKKDSPLVQNL